MLSTTRRSPHTKFGVIGRIGDRDITYLSFHWPDTQTHTQTYRQGHLNTSQHPPGRGNETVKLHQFPYQPRYASNAHH